MKEAGECILILNYRFGLIFVGKYTIPAPSILWNNLNLKMGPRDSSVSKLEFPVYTRSNRESVHTLPPRKFSSALLVFLGDCGLPTCLSLLGRKPQHWGRKPQHWGGNLNIGGVGGWVGAWDPSISP